MRGDGGNGKSKISRVCLRELPPEWAVKGFCASKDAAAIIGRFMEELDDRDLSGEVMVTNTGCFGVCDKGPIVVVYPEGIWYKGVTEDDVERIVEQHLENGTVVADLQL